LPVPGLVTRSTRPRRSVEATIFVVLRESRSRCQPVNSARRRNDVRRRDAASRCCGGLQRDRARVRRDVQNQLKGVNRRRNRCDRRRPAARPASRGHRAGPCDTRPAMGCATRSAARRAARSRLFKGWGDEQNDESGLQHDPPG
jgi:hypothetical protein